MYVALFTATLDHTTSSQKNSHYLNNLIRRGDDKHLENQTRSRYLRASLPIPKLTLAYRDNNGGIRSARYPAARNTTLRVRAVACPGRAWNQHSVPVLRAPEAESHTIAPPMQLPTAGGEESAIITCLVSASSTDTTVVERLADAVAMVDPCPSTRFFQR